MAFPVNMPITYDQALLLLRLLQADDDDNRENDLDREAEFEELEAKLIVVINLGPC